MVRLKQKLLDKIYELENESQFHYGSIKTILQQMPFLSKRLQSQFHYGSIKTHIHFNVFDGDTNISLNSTMVRLKP